MTPHHPSERDRLAELLTDQLTHGLDDADRGELERLLAKFGPAEQEAFERAAAALDLSLNATTFPALPADLAERLRASATPHLSAPVVRGTPPPRPARRRETLAWLAAAACLLLALTTWAPWRGKPLAPTLAQQREELLRVESDVVNLPWTATKDPAAANASGDVVWSNRAQRGFMRFRGLAANNPAQSQYQLWIFDADRDERYPVDGGVFDVDPSTGDVIVAITPALRVARPTLFAVTVEKPGGVVVSTRERLPLLAKAAPRG